MPTSIPSSTLEKFVTFGDLLRFLRRRAGLTQMELAIAVGYSNTQISRLEQNERLPDIPTIEARFVSALGIEQEPKAVARLLDLAANVRREDAPAPGASPYKGLNYFDESDANLFVGREALTVKLTELVLSLATNRLAEGVRFLAIVGASGSGKSSLVRAGLVSALRWNKASTDWHVYVLTPTSRPLESLATTLTQESNSVIATATLMDDLARDERSLQIFARRIVGAKNGSYILLVVDQFEELFALCRSEEERSAFIGNLLTAASETDGAIIVVITLRADFYAYCANYPRLREALAGHQEYIGAMNDEEMRRAIEEPARRGRWEFEPGLVDLLLHDVGHEPGALPLLSHALFETWQRRRGHTMTLSGYTSSGGVRGAIAETAETVFTDQFTREQRSIARRIFLRLTELGDQISAADTRRRATFEELILKSEEAATTHVVLRALADARLITTTEDSAEVAHEALIREWPTLRGWLEENREGLRLHHQLTEAAQEWQALTRAPDVLYRGARLTQASEWAASHAEEMNTLEREFLAASMQAVERDVREREAQRQRELESAYKLAEAEKQRAEMESKRAQEQVRASAQLRKRAYYLTGAFAIALVMAFAALFFGRQVQLASQQIQLASRQVQVASSQVQLASRLATSRELAAASIANLEVDPERSILLALEALDTSYTVEAEDALHRAVETSHLERIIAAHNPGAPMLVALHPAGDQVLTAAGDGTVTTWDIVAGKELLRLNGLSAAYSPDGKRLAIVIPNRTVQLLDLTTGNKISLAGQVDANLTVAFSPDGTRLATVAANNIPKLWDARTGQELVAFRGHTDLISSAVFSPDGTGLLTASDDHTARVWDTSTGEQLLNLSDHVDRVVGAQYSPDGKRIATISGNEAYIWDANSGERLLILTGHQEAICTVAF